MKSIKMLMMAALTIVSISLFAQDNTKQKSKDSKHKMEMTKYSCPMHPDVVSNKPGKCTKCGMDLTKSNNKLMKMEATKMYSCPMHPEVTSDKPGKCTKCGMSLKEKSPATVTYACPMKCEGDKTYNEPGTCAKCGMALEKLNDDHSNHKH
ncbi:MAG TPA: heavy metal-binding domain-containing protein [Saprospiraceae bacterium]|nr:heavy metal-binding domain-containing protein [Saprospiraceae bacterium]HQW56607.1 heavy metal-binding domain-containing protein [Saprospiraceae bacterium]